MSNLDSHAFLRKPRIKRTKNEFEQQPHLHAIYFILSWDRRSWNKNVKNLLFSHLDWRRGNSITLKNPLAYEWFYQCSRKSLAPMFWWATSQFRRDQR
jgi:hypothetical protein